MRGLNLKENNVIRAGDSPRTNSGAAAAIARSKLDQFQRFKSAPSVAYEFHFNYGAIVMNLVIFAIGVIALVFSN